MAPPQRFTPIPEGSENEDEGSERRHHPSPGVKAKKRQEVVSVTCSNCRPSGRDKTASSVVPVCGGEAMPSPNGILKSILCTLAWRSPKPAASESEVSFVAASAAEDRWKVAVAEISQKLMHASRKRDEAILEASRLKYSIAELEDKLDRLEIHCRGLDSGFAAHAGGKIGDGHDQIVANFRFYVSEARAAVRSLSRALMVQIRQTSVKVSDRISSLLQPSDVKFPQFENPRTLIFYLEALLNSALFEDFESAGFIKSSTNRILNPLDRCEAQYAAFKALQGLTWEEVLNKGTKHFSEDFSRFCDRKMSEIVLMLGWNRPWTEPLLQAFFAASKSVWLVHLLANSVHPGLPIFRVENGSVFDSTYMEDSDVDRATPRPDLAVVRVMVAPGFYVYDNVIKCKALCRCVSNSVTNLGVNGSGTHER